MTANISERNFSLVYGVLASIFVLSIASQPYPGSFIVKALPVLLLSLYSYSRRSAVSPVLAVAFLFSAGGDIALDLDRAGLFVVGLGLFLITHVLYAYLFGRERSPDTKGRLAGGVLTAFSVGMVVVMLPKLAGLMVPVLVYIAVITFMGGLCFIYRRRNPLLITGVILFVVSDSFIAVNKFLFAFEESRYIIILTYYSGQLLIALGFARAFAGPKSEV